MTPASFSIFTARRPLLGLSCLSVLHWGEFLVVGGCSLHCWGHWDSLYFWEMYVYMFWKNPTQQ
jgi:hypothetical protein